MQKTRLERKVLKAGSQRLEWELVPGFEAEQIQNSRQMRRERNDGNAPTVPRACPPSFWRVDVRHKSLDLR